MLYKSIIKAQSIRGFKTSASAMIKAGDAIPKVTLFENSPGNSVDIAEEVSQGKTVIVGVPGAFSPACSASHVPGYLKKLRDFNEKGYNKFLIVSVNDPFVMKAWGEQLLQSGSTAQVKFLADSKADFVSAADLKFNADKVFGNERAKRFALLVHEGKVHKLFAEPDNTSVDVSDASKVLQQV